MKFELGGKIVTEISLKTHSYLIADSDLKIAKGTKKCDIKKENLNLKILNIF